MNEAELLFSEILGCDRTTLYLDKAKILGHNELAFISSVLKRRIKGEPIQYILGKTEFMALKLKVNQDVLIPRPETEILVETTLKYADKIRQAEILDLGTGSGCIAISLGKILEGAKIDAIDISDKALSVAEENARLNGAKIDFIQSDLFDSLGGREYDIIVSNPPYIADDEIGRLQPELQFEPRIALAAGVDGLDFYRRINLKASGYLKKNGFLIMEIGFGQAGHLVGLFSESNKFKVVETVKDYNNIERVIVAQKV